MKMKAKLDTEHPFGIDIAWHRSKLSSDMNKNRVDFGKYLFCFVLFVL